MRITYEMKITGTNASRKHEYHQNILIFIFIMIIINYYYYYYASQKREMCPIFFQTQYKFISTFFSRTHTVYQFLINFRSIQIQFSSHVLIGFFAPHSQMSFQI